MNMQELFTDPSLTYSKRENAVKSLEARIQRYYGKDSAWRVCYVIATTKEGRYFPVVLGSDHMGLVHAGICVASINNRAFCETFVKLL